MTGAEIVLAVVAVALAAANIVQSREFAKERKSLLVEYRAKARQDHLATTATNAREFMYAEGLYAEGLRDRADAPIRSEPEPPFEGMG